MQSLKSMFQGCSLRNDQGRQHDATYHATHGTAGIALFGIKLLASLVAVFGLPALN